MNVVAALSLTRTDHSFQKFDVLLLLNYFVANIYFLWAILQMCIVVQKRLNVLVHDRVILICFNLISRCYVVRIGIAITN